MAKKKPVDPIEGEETQDQVVEETTTEETQSVAEVPAEEPIVEEVNQEEDSFKVFLPTNFQDSAESIEGGSTLTEFESESKPEAKPEKPMQIGKDGNPILPAEEHVKNWGVMTKVPFGQKDELGESE
jgi:hypothetical protein